MKNGGCAPISQRLPTVKSDSRAHGGCLDPFPFETALSVSLCHLSLRVSGPLVHWPAKRAFFAYGKPAPNGLIAAPMALQLWYGGADIRAGRADRDGWWENGGGAEEPADARGHARPGGDPGRRPGRNPYGWKT